MESKSKVLLNLENSAEIFYTGEYSKSEVLLNLENSAEIFYTGE